MVDPKQFHTWVHFLLLHLLILLKRHGAEAQSPIQPEPRFATHQSWHPSVAVIVGALFCAFLIVGLVSVYLRRCAESYVAERNPIGGGAAVDWPCSCSKGINGEILDKFPILFYSTIKDLKIGKGALECAVCLNEFKDYETLRLLPKCNHVFHPDCIDAWLSSHVTCPVCRANSNQDLGKFAFNLETQLNANQVYDESSDNRAEQSGDINEIEQNPVTPNSNEGQRNAEEDAGKQNLPSRSNILGKFQRSNSTGHSLVEPGKCLERYTLRLPEDVRTYILLNHERMERSASYNVVISSRKGLCSSDSEGSSRGKKITVEGSSRGKRNIVELWQERKVLPRTPPFVGVEGSSVTGNSSNTCSACPVFCSWQKI